MSKYSNLGEILLDLAGQSAKGITFVELSEKDRFESYGNICKKAGAGLFRLQEKGLKPGDKVIFQIEDNELFIEAFWACILGGIIPVPLPLADNYEQLQRLQKVWSALGKPYILEGQSKGFNNAEAAGSEINEEINNYKITMDSAAQIAEVGEVYAAKPQDIALIQFSSGSTGEPKGVVLTHRNILSNIEAIHNALGLSERDIPLSWLPLTHDMGLVGLHLVPFFSGLSQYIMRTVDFIQQPVQWLVKAQEYKATFLACPNFSLLHFLNNFKQEMANNWDLSCVRVMLNGSEPISAELCSKFLSMLCKYKLESTVMFPVYGLAEATLAVSFPPVGEHFSKIIVDRSSIGIGDKVKKVDGQECANGISFIDLGYPLPCIELRICDDNNNISAADEIGHIQIKGSCVTEGYYNNRAETEKILSKDGWLDTGDLGFLTGGRLFVTGRAKDIIFVNGQNYYSYDIERIIQVSMNGAVCEVAACGCYDKEAEKEIIIIFVKYSGSIDSFVEVSQAIKKFLKSKMGLNADYIIPVQDVAKTNSGKVQRYKLLEQYQKGMMDREINELIELESLRTEPKVAYPAEKGLDEKILNIFRTILNNAEIATNDNLMEIGGSSITMMQAAAQISREIGRSVSFRTLYEYNSAAKLAQYLLKPDNEFDKAAYPLYEPDKKNKYKAFGLTDIQNAYLMGRNSNFELGGTSTHFYVEFATSLDIVRLSRSLNKLIKRHPMLRAIVLPEGQQMILEEIPEYMIRSIDITSMDAVEQEILLKTERDKWSHHIFDSSRWPLFDFHSYKTGDEENLLCISMDMLIADGASIQILVRDLTEFYENPDAEKAETEFTYRDYIMAYQEIKKSERYLKDREYWTGRVDSFPTAPALPLKKKVSEVKKPRYKRLRKVLNSGMWERIKEKAKENGITPSALLCTAYAQILSWWSNQSELSVSLTAFNRYPFNPQVNDIVGDFTSVLPLGITFKGGESFWERAGHLQGVLFEALEHMHYDGVEFVREIARRRSMETEVILPVVFTSMLFDKRHDSWGKMGVMNYSISQTSQVYLDSQVMELGNELLLTWDYVEELFDEKEISCMFEQYTGIIGSIAAGSSIYEPKPMCCQRDLIEKYNLTQEDITPETLHGMFEAQVERTPDNTAIIFEDESITYSELNLRANRMARFLSGKGIKEGSCVGVHAVRGIDTIANIMGILKAGAAYVPVDPSIPEDRKRFILENSGCSMLLSPESFDAESIESYSGECVEVFNSINALAYIIYTSGSTGRPKGVMITHKAASNTIIDINRKFDISGKDRIIGISSLCFDLSVYDIFGALSTGAILVIVKDQKDVDDIREVLDKYDITFWNTVPAIMGMLLDSIDEDYENSSIRNVLLSGDWIPVNMPERIWNHFRNAEVTSLGGATEASIWSIYYPIVEINSEWKSIPYGYPLANQSYYVLNYQMGLCPVGVPGELYIGGVGVASGYINDEEKTRNAFIRHPEFGYIYKTGDYGILHGNGYIEFLGRRDQQVKIRGYRIELGEIETVIRQNEKVQEAIAAVIDIPGGTQQLIGYVVPKDAGNGSEYARLWSEAARAGKERMTILPAEVPPERYAAFAEMIEELSTAYIYNAFIQMEVFLMDGEVVSLDDLILKRGFKPVYRKLLRQWLSVMEEDGIIRSLDDDRYISERRLKKQSLDEIWEKINEDLIREYWESSFNYLRLCTSNIIEILKGEVNPLNLLFPEGSWERAENVYRYNPVAEYYNSIAAEIIKSVIENWPKDKKIRILEFGAGTGGTTASLLPVIPPERTIYTYTDISSFFTDIARKIFEDCPFMEYAVYDIDKEPAEQGLKLHSYDIIIGANVLLEAKHLNNTLNQFKSLLTAEGLCLILELTENTRMQKITIGFIEGLSDYKDERRDKNQPLLEPQEWKAIFENCGFDNFTFFPEAGFKSELFGQHVMVAKGPASLKWIDEEVLQEELRIKLPEYMVPTRIINIERIPLNANGKVDRKALPRPYIKEESSSSYVPPKNETERLLVSIWQEVLGLERVGTRENFFAIGGDSLKAIQIVTKAKQHRIMLSITDIYNCMTIEELAKHIIQSEPHALVEASGIAEIEECAAAVDKSKALDSESLYEAFSLTDVQLAYVMGRDTQFELGGTSTHYYVELDTNLQMERLNRSLNRVIARHPMMRTVFGREGNQKILEQVPDYIIAVEDLTEYEANLQEERIAGERNRMSHHMFNIEEWPLFEFKAFKLKSGRYYLCIGIDILIADGASIYIIGRELKEFYDKPQLLKPEIEYTFRDYIMQLQSFRRSEAYLKDKKYWLEKLNDFPASPNLPLIQSPRTVMKPHFNRISKTFNRSEWEKIKKKARENNITPAALLCTAYCSVLDFWSNQGHFAIDLTVFNRLPFHRDIDKLVGDFTSLVLLDIDFTSKADFWERAKQVQNTLMEALEHRNYDGVEFIRELIKHNNLGTKAIMPVVFTCELFNDARDGWSGIGKMKYAISQTPQVYLDNQTVDMNGELLIAWDYEDSLFNKEIIDQMFNQYMDCISGVVGNEDDCLPEVSEKDKKEILLYNMSEENITVTTLHGLFEERVKECPLQTAVIFEDQQISYKELNERSNQVARYLNASGIDRNLPVGVSAKRCIGTIVNILGILKAGSAYVPIEPNYPEDRKDFILKNSGCPLFLEPELYKSEEVICHSVQDIGSTIAPESIAYIIYTSGSTGRPKGVVIKHSAAANTIIDINRKFNISCKDKIIGLSSMCFDLSVYDIFGTLSTGATLVMIKDQRDVKNVTDIIDKHKITFWNSVPAIMDMVSENIEPGYVNENLRNVLLSGDWIPVRLPQKIRKHFINSRVTSLGGATEASIWSIYYPISEVKDNWTSIPYGYPLANQSFYVLRDDGGLCPVGVQGELHIGGVGVAEGYMNDKEKTDKAFIVHPILGRLYKTGDYGAFKKEGYIEFLGRKDQQVKIRGYRIELGEIQTVIEQFQGIKEAVVTVDDGNQGSKRLVGYIVPETVEPESEDQEGTKAGKHNTIKVFESIAEAAGKQAQNYPESLSPEKYIGLWNEIETLSTAYMCKVLKGLNVLSCKGESWKIEELLQKCRIVPGYRKLFKQWLDVLVEDGILEKDGELAYNCIKGLPDNDVEKMWEDLRKAIDNPELELPLNYLKLSSRNHIAMLTGEVNPLELFFPEGMTETALSIYRFNPIAEYVNSIAASVLKAAADSVAEGHKIRILEVGAGTGGTTESILPVLAGKAVSYMFTDLSTFFTAEARKRFKDYTFMEYGILDINEEPQMQGFELNSFDIVIGANVLHDARNINKSLNYIKSLLTPEKGVLLLIEGTRNTRQQMVSVEFIEGFSHYEDDRILDNLPLLSTEKWGKTIESCGFDSFAYFPEKGCPGEVFNQHVMLAAGSNGAKWIRTDEIRSYLGKLLPDYMIPSCFMQIEKIPLSANGKVDKKALPKPEEEQHMRNNYAAPVNEIQEIMVQIWEETLEVDKVGIYDNFFDLGGDSLKAIRVVAKLGLYFDIDLNKFFNSGTIFALSQGLSMKKEYLKDKLNKVIGVTAIVLDEYGMPKNMKKSLWDYRWKYEAYSGVDITEKDAVENVLLTGATGYLGIHILHELLEKTDYNIYLLVRAKTREATANRIKEKYNYYFNDRIYQENSNRVFYINGNITMERFGMPQEEYDELAGKVDSIIHCAAMVKHLGKYEDFYEMNVEGAGRVIEFAGHKKGKAINHVSSTGVGAGINNSNETVLFTEYDYDIGQSFRNNYLKSKFECEKIMLKARERGINVNLYRMGNLAFNSATGKFQSNIEENIGYLLLRAFMKLGMLPDIEKQYSDVTYIDYAAKAVCLLFDRKNLRNETYHIYNTKLVGFKDMWEALKEYAPALKLCSMEEIVEFIKDNYDNKELLPYFENLLFHSDVIAAMNDTRMVKTAEKTEMLLKSLDFEWEKPTKQQYIKSLEYCKQIGFI